MASSASMPKACKEMTEKEMKSRRSLNLRRNDMHLQPLVCLCTMNPRPAQRLRYQFLASLPHLDVFDVSKCGCEPYTQPCTSTMLTNSWRASSRHPHIPTLSRSVGRVFEWCILASALFILVSSLLSEFLRTPLSIHSFDS